RARRARWQRRCGPPSNASWRPPHPAPRCCRASRPAERTPVSSETRASSRTASDSCRQPSPTTSSRPGSPATTSGSTSSRCASRHSAGSTCAVTSSADRPLEGRSVVVTRAAEQASRLVATLAHLGATVVEVPTIAIVDAPDGGAALGAAVAALARYDWVVLTSTNGVARFLAALEGRSTAGVRVAVVGPGTAGALRAGGIEPALLPERFVAEALLEAFPPGPGPGLLPQASAAPPVLAHGPPAA